MTRQSVAAFRQITTVQWPVRQKEGARQHLINIAHAGHAKIMADASSRGSVPTFDAYANTPGTPVEAVILPGPIVYRYRYFGEVVAVARKALDDASPQVSGAYKAGHKLFVNGAMVATLPTNLKPGDEVMLANLVPYARKIEIGKTKSGRAFVIQVPNRIYERVAKGLQPRFRNSAKITFAYVSISGAHLTRKRGAVKAPAIIIEALT